MSGQAQPIVGSLVLPTLALTGVAVSLKIGGMGPAMAGVLLVSLVSEAPRGGSTGRAVRLDARSPDVLRWEAGAGVVRAGASAHRPAHEDEGPPWRW
jgi:hypothetical protein